MKVSSAQVGVLLRLNRGDRLLRVDHSRAEDGISYIFDAGAAGVNRRTVGILLKLGLIEPYRVGSLCEAYRITKLGRSTVRKWNKEAHGSGNRT